MNLRFPFDYELKVLILLWIEGFSFNYELKVLLWLWIKGSPSTMNKGFSFDYE